MTTETMAKPFEKPVEKIAEKPTEKPVEKTRSALLPAHRETVPPFMSLQRDINRLFEEFHRGFDLV